MSGASERIAGALLCALLLGCGVPERDSPLDPASGQEVDPAELLIGTWSRVDAEKNEVYTFKPNGACELWDYSPGPESSAMDLSEVDRNAPFPQTLYIQFSGTYLLRGNLLSLSFTGVATNDPDSALPSLPPQDKVVSIVVGVDQLIIEERDGDRLYTRI